MAEHDYTDCTDGQVSVSPSSWLSHPDYDSSTDDNDFAIVKLATSLTFSRYILASVLECTHVRERQNKEENIEIS